MFLQDAPRVFLCYKNTYARENYSPRRGPVPGRKAGRPPFARALLGAARRNPACDVDKMPSPNFGSYRELNPQDAPRVFLCYKNTYARENYSPRRGSVPGRKAGRPPFARVLYSCLVRRDVKDNALRIEGRSWRGVAAVSLPCKGRRSG